MTVDWTKCNGNVWCKLNEVDLSSSHFNHMIGVYIIWHGGDNPRTVRVGQGFIRDRLQEHRLDPKVQRYASFGLYATWARVPRSDLDGVEVFLAQHLKPLVGEKFPNVPPIPVNLPW